METEKQPGRADATLTNVNQQVVRLIRLVESGEMTATSVIQQLVDTLGAQIVGLYEDIAAAERAVNAYAAMDKAQQEVLKYVRATVGHMAQANAMHVAHIDQLNKARSRVAELVALAQENENVVLDTEGVVEALGLGAAPAYPPQDPVAVGLSPDSRYSAGEFEHGPARLRLPFIGWTLVVHSRFSHTKLEPTFWFSEENQALTESDLLIRGGKLLRLV